MSKSTKATVERRIDEISQLLIVGAGLPYVRQLASTKDWGVGDRQIRRYYDAARDRLAKLADDKLNHLLGLQLAQRQALFAQAIKEKDFALGLEILKDGAKLLGLYQKPNAAPVILSEQSPAKQLESRSHTPEAQLGLFEKLRKEQQDGLTAIRQELLGRPDILDRFRDEAIASMDESSLPGESG